MNSDNDFPTRAGGRNAAVRVYRFFILTMLSLVLVSCSEEVVETEPEGAYTIWRQALFDGDEGRVYEQLDAQTKRVFQERLERLLLMSQDIQRYLPQADQKLAREQTGVVMLSQRGIKDGENVARLCMLVD